MNQPTTYNYAGLGDVTRPGLSVQDAAARLRRFAWIKEQLLFIQAVHFVEVPERDLKVLLGRLLFQDARDCTLLRARLKELRVPKARLQSSPDDALTALLDEAMHSRSTAEVVASLRWLNARLGESCEAYLRDTNPLADWPSAALLRDMAAREREAIVLLDLAGDDLLRGDAEKSEARDFVDHLERYLGAAAGLDGIAPRAQPLLPERARAPYAIRHELSRDESLGRVWDFAAPPQTEIGAHLAYMMGLRLSEINVAEGLAIVLYETKGKPWEFYADIARHLWDEVRHSLMGEAAIAATLGDRAALPMRDYEGVYCMEAPPLEQYATLGLEIEGASMRYPIGKRGEWEFCRDLARHPLMTTFQDFDWADEVVHVNVARQQLSNWFPGGVKELSEFAARGKANRSSVKTRHPATPVPAPPDIIERGRALTKTTNEK